MQGACVVTNEVPVKQSVLLQDVCFNIKSQKGISPPGVQELFSIWYLNVLYVIIDTHTSYTWTFDLAACFHFMWMQ